MMRLLELGMVLGLLVPVVLLGASLANEPGERMPGRVHALRDGDAEGGGPETDVDTETGVETETTETRGPPEDATVGVSLTPTTSEWPAVAVGTDGRWMCSGVLVGPHVVLTARHCLPATKVLHGDSIFHAEQVSRVVAYRMLADPRIDVAVLRVEPAMPEPFATVSAERDVPSGLVMVGYGARSPDGRRGFGYRLDQSASISSWGCTPYRAGHFGCLPGLELVVPNEVGVDTCDGDSGGPVYADEDGLRLVGLTSRPVAGARSRCGDGGIYTRLDPLRAELETLIKSLNTSNFDGGKVP